MTTVRIMLFSLLTFFSIFMPSYATSSTSSLTYLSPEKLVSTDSRVTRTVRSFKRDGYVEAARVYHQVMYFVAPSEDYKSGEYVITLRKSAGNYSLTTYYADVHVEVYADVETGQFYIGRLWTEETVVH